MSGPVVIASAEQLISIAANSLTAVLAIVTICAAILRPVAPIRAAMLRTMLRRPARSPTAWRVEGIHNLLGTPATTPSRRNDLLRLVSRPNLRARRRLIRDLSLPVRRVLDGEQLLPADCLAAFLASRPGARPWPDQAIALRSLMRAASTTRAAGLLARLLYPDDVAMIRRLCSDLAAHLGRFAEASPVPVARLASAVGDDTFALFATRLSGAVILVDAVETRSRLADGTLVWHERAYRGAQMSVADEHSTRDGYRTAHARGSACELGTTVPDRRVGDFDRRVLNLESVTIVESTSAGRVVFALETTETCYLATEQGDALLAADAPRRERIGCKHLLPGRTEPELDSIVTADPAAPGLYGVRVGRRGAGRVCLLTSYTFVLTSDDHLVLARRSKKVRHGQDVISATAGGVIEPDDDGPLGDVDDVGMPSPLRGVLREAAEEIGMTTDEFSVKPICVFLANVRNTSGTRVGRGQVLAAVLHVARLDRPWSDVAGDVAKADPSLGRFELEDLVAIPIGVHATSGCRTSQTGTSRTLARYARDHASDLDQHGLLSMLYAAAYLDGPDSARAAFTEAFADRPWWDIPAGDIRPRVVRSPATLLGMTTFDTAPEADWAAAWAGLDDSLIAASPRSKSANRRGRHERAV